MNRFWEWMKNKHYGIFEDYDQIQKSSPGTQENNY